MKKYEVTFFDIVYMEKKIEVIASDAPTAFLKATQRHESGMADKSWETVATKKWRKPTVLRIK